MANNNGSSAANNNVLSGLGILIEEKELDPYSSHSPHSISPVNESLLPPLPSSASSLPLQTLDSPAVSSSSFSNVPKDSASCWNSAVTGSEELVSAQTRAPPPPALALPLHDSTPNFNIRSPLQATVQAFSSTTTRQGSTSSVNSVASHSTTTSSTTTNVNSNNKAVLTRIKSGLRKLSSPLISSSSSKTDLLLQLHQLQQQQDSNAYSSDFDYSNLDLSNDTTANSSQQLVLFKRPFLPRHVSTVSTGSNSSSLSSLNPLGVPKHSHTNSSTSNKTVDNLSNLLTTPMTSPIIAVNEKFRSRASSDGSDFHFPPHSSTESVHHGNKFSLDQYDTIEEKASYVELLKKQMENEDAAYKITERRLLSSGWITNEEIEDLRKRREAAIKNWRENIDRLEGILYRNEQP